MQTTYEARLTLYPELAELLRENARHWNWGKRTAWSRRFRLGEAETTVYAFLTGHGFTSHQANSLLSQVEMQYAALKEGKAHEHEQLQAGIAQRQTAWRKKTAYLQGLQGRHGLAQETAQALAPKVNSPRTAAYADALRLVRQLSKKITAAEAWLTQKTRVLTAKQAQLVTLRRTIERGRFSLCFGTQQLLAQRPSAHNGGTTPFPTDAAWRRTWDNARNGQWWSTGARRKALSNPEITWDPTTGLVRARLTDQVAEQAMAEIGIPVTGGNARVMARRMACRFVSLGPADFVSHHGQARALLAQAMGRQPVTLTPQEGPVLQVGDELRFC